MIISDEKEDKLRRIRSLFLRDYSLDMIHQMEGVSLTFLRSNFKNQFQKPYVKVLGHKSESYYTEDEMLDPPKYCYETLSDSEKEIYHKLSGEF
jgi:hypothetical protein